MQELVTISAIIEWMTKQVEERQPIDPNTWMDASLKMNVLLQSEQERLFTLEQEVAILKKTLLEDGKSVAYARVMIEATDEYKNCKIQKAKIERCVEFIRLSKLHSRMSNDIKNTM